VRDWLERRDAIWVRHGDFDQFMLLAQAEFDIPHPDAGRFQQVFERYVETHQRLSGEVSALPADAPEAAALKDAVRQSADAARDWWAFALAAQAAWLEGDLALAEERYELALTNFPSTPALFRQYAWFVWKERADASRATALLDRAVHLAPGEPALLFNRALLSIGPLCGSGAEEALRALRESAFDPQSVQVLTAEFYLRFGREDDGNALLTNLMSGPLSVDASNRLGLLLLEIDRVDDARVYLGKMGEGEPALSWVLANQANLAYFDRDISRGRALFDRARHSDDPNLRAEIEREFLWLEAVHAGPSERRKALANLKGRVLGGARSLGFAFRPHLRQVQRSQRTFFECLAEVIHGWRPVEDLDEFEQWREA
jgi:tetratricopeptide (TPR) repeat protein